MHLPSIPNSIIIIHFVHFVHIFYIFYILHLSPKCIQRNYNLLLVFFSIHIMMFFFKNNRGNIFFRIFFFIISTTSSKSSLYIPLSTIWIQSPKVHSTRIIHFRNNNRCRRYRFSSLAPSIHHPIIVISISISFQEPRRLLPIFPMDFAWIITLPIF